MKLRGDCHSSGVGEPVPALTAGGFHVGEVRAFLTAYYGADGTGGQDLADPMRTVTSKDRLGLVTVEGADYQIVDIGMRMLTPPELLRAQFGRFASRYDLSLAIGERTLKKLQRRAKETGESLIDLIVSIPPAKRKPTHTTAVRLIGNSVCPEVAEAIVRANVGDEQRAVTAA